MRPEFNSRRYLGITRSKGKMYELGLPEETHIAVPAGVEPAALFPLSIATLMDAAASLNDAVNPHHDLPAELRSELGFAASFFDAYLSSRFNDDISDEVMLFASAAYFIGQRPGSSFVLARRLPADTGDALQQALVWALKADWRRVPVLAAHPVGGWLAELVTRIRAHFNDGAASRPVEEVLLELRRQAYANGTSREVVLTEVSSAIVKSRLESSSWNLLPGFSGLTAADWAPAIRKAGFPKELWPSQKLLGEAGIFAGRSGIVQMPTSAGKTRSVEVILRGAFLADRTRVAILVAPFRALCHEIAGSLRLAFKGEDVKVNELSDALQLDFVDQLAELLGAVAPATRNLLVLTPEKLLYVLRQEPSLVAHIGLVVYDEGHQFDTGARGITYELLLTEIKSLLQSAAQTVLISAVITNATAVGTWLIGAEPNVVDGTGLLSTARSVAFARWAEQRGQLLFFESGAYEQSDYFVPRAIEAQELQLRGKERKVRFFPEKGDDSWKDVSLYLGIRLAPSGAVAVFCGRKDTASGLAERAVEVYRRGFALPPPATASNAAEIQTLTHLAAMHFGAESTVAQAAALGVFVHHGTTPQGLRLAIEHAMQRELIKLVVCTSTLAQGVNLPIRYLIVSGVNQGEDQIKTRDFQNLMGRAGRAGMHTEGLVLFADPRVVDRWPARDWRMNAAIGLMQPENAEATSSSLLTLLAPLASPEGIGLPLATDVLLAAYFLRGEQLSAWADAVVAALPQYVLNKVDVIKAISKRQKLVTALESYLMANRGAESFEELTPRVRLLAQSTLAHALADEGSKAALGRLFELAAAHIEQVLPDPARQATYAKTLLGVLDAARVEAWVSERAELLRALMTNDEWLRAVWPLFLEVVDNKILTGTEPPEVPFQLAQGWIQGSTYQGLIALAKATEATKPWGEKRRRKLSDADVLDFLEGCLGFDCSLVVAAIGQFLFGATGLNSEGTASLTEFQKAMKYGLPSKLAVSVYEAGLADRFIANDVALSLSLFGYAGSHFIPALAEHRDVVSELLQRYPSYFTDVLQGL